MITIVVTHEDGQSDEFDFDSSHSNISIGRRSTNDVCIPNLSVSGRHARVVFNEGEAWVEDLNSTNGTYISNRLISRQILNHNDELVIGKTRVRYENAAAGKTLDAQPEVETDVIDEAHSFDESLPVETIAEVDAAPAIPPKISAPVAATATASSTTSSEAMFESLADDLAEPEVVAQHHAAPTESFDDDDADLPADDDAPMTLSEKAKLALGRGASKPTLAAVNGAAATTAASAVAATASVTDAVVETPQVKTQPAPTEKHAGAVIEIKNGAKSGQVLPIDKPVTTLGRPGIQIAAIMRKPDGYFLMHIESDDSVDRPTLNSDAIGDEPMLLQSGDELNVAGIDVEFNLA